MIENIDTIPDIYMISLLIQLPALYEQLAEECAELSQAALKKSRKLRGENFTPKTMDEIDANLSEEVTDVLLCLDSLGLCSDEKIREAKIKRWIARNDHEKSE